jgi:phosphatidylinositol-3-phosphatase
MRRGLMGQLAVWILFSTFIAASAQAAGTRPNWPGPNDQIKHVFVIILENEGFQAAFGPKSPATYLSQTLPTQGVLLEQYYSTGHVSLDNYISMISGQAATPQTRTDCQVYQDYTLTGVTPDGQAIGSGCVYPATIQTLPDQLSAAGLTWRGYMEDMGNDPTRESSVCGHPVLGAQDLTQVAEAPSAAVPLGDQYASRHDPFVYFHSIIDSPNCQKNVVALPQLASDLASEASTPSLVFITPNLCNDGHDAPCRNGQPGGLVSADQFLRKWVPMIMASPAYQHGLLIVTFDEADLDIEEGSSGVVVSASGTTCCSQQPGPNLAPFPQSTTGTGFTEVFGSFGGDQIGAVLLSPFLQAGTVSETPFNHYSMLRSIEDIFALGHLGYAASPGLIGFFGCASTDIKPSPPQPSSEACSSVTRRAFPLER